MNFFTLLSFILLEAHLILGHMLMKAPLSRGYKNNPSYSPIDYDLNGPIHSPVRIL